MGSEQQLLTELKEMHASVQRAGAASKQRIVDLENSVNEILTGLRRPGSESHGEGHDFERKSAVQMCVDRHSWLHQKHEGRWLEYAPSRDEIDEAVTAQRAYRALLRHGDFTRLDHEHQKSLSSFAFGNTGWVVPPQVSSRVLSCLTDQTDFLSMLGQENISAGSVQFPLDNSELEGAEWACETSCAGPAATIQPPGLLEIKAESLRAVVCSTTDLLQDASFNIEGWIQRKAARAFRQKLANAFISGDGLGKPAGILNPKSGIPICDTSPNTPPGQLTWQDLIAIKFQLPEEYAARGTFLMSASTLGLILTMSDASGRPIWMQTPASDGRVGGGFQIAGSPVRVVSQFPDIAPGSTPVLFADLEQLYLVVTRRALTFQSDPYTMNFCVKFTMDARIGGAVVCPSAGRLLRIQ